MRTLEVGRIYRYPDKRESRRLLDNGGRLPEVVEGLRNLSSILVANDGTLTQLERGINPIASVAARDGNRMPCVLIRSSPNKAGTAQTPWVDDLRPDEGWGHYYGDAKVIRQPPETVPGNRTLLGQTDLHRSSDHAIRIRSVPLLVFKTTPWGGRPKGQVVFLGLAVLKGAEPVRQSDPDGAAFDNFRFRFSFLDLTPDSGLVDWEWIEARRTPDISLEESLDVSPIAWRRWIRSG